MTEGITKQPVDTITSLTTDQLIALAAATACEIIRAVSPRGVSIRSHEIRKRLAEAVAVARSDASETISQQVRADCVLSLLQPDSVPQAVLLGSEQVQEP